MNLNNIIVSLVFERCDECNKKMKEIIMPISDMKAIEEFKIKGRLCQKCAKESKFNDDVITIDLRKRGIIW